MAKTYTYEWTSQKTGKPVSLSATISTKDTDTMSHLELHVSHNGREFRWNPLGLCGLTRKMGLPHTDFVTCPLKEIGGDAMIKLSIPWDIASDIQDKMDTAEADHVTYMMTDAKLRYEVHPDNILDINSGFSDSLISSLISRRVDMIGKDIEAANKEASHVFLIAMDDALSRKIKSQLDDIFFDQALDDYTPFPAHKWWSGEYLEVYNKQLAEHTAPGEAYIRSADVMTALDFLLADLFSAKLQDMVAEYDRTADKEANYAHHYTPEEVAAWEEQYNKVVNEGGEGYVPHIITQYEAAQAADMADACAAMIRKLKRIKRA